MSIKFHYKSLNFSQTNYGTASTKNRKDFTIFKNELEENYTRPATLSFAVRYGKLRNIPSLVSIRLNGKNFCNQKPKCVDVTYYKLTCENNFGSSNFSVNFNSIRSGDNVEIAFDRRVAVLKVSDIFAVKCLFILHFSIRKLT